MFTLLDALGIALPLVTGIGLIAIAVVVLRASRDHSHNWFFSLLYGLSGAKSVCEGLFAYADAFHARSALFPDRTALIRADVVAATFMVPLLLMLVLSFPRPMKWV